MPKTTTEMTASLISYSSTMSRVALTDSSALPSNKKTPAHETMEGHQEKTDCRRLLYRHQGHLAGPAYRPGDTGRNMMWSDYLSISVTSDSFFETLQTIYDVEVGAHAKTVSRNR